LPDGTLPPPTQSLTLTATPFEPGEVATLSVTGLAVGELVHFVRGDEQATGACFDIMGGLCLDVAPYAYLGARNADRNGVAEMRLPVPATVPVGLSSWFQAVAMRGDNSTKSAAVYGIVGGEPEDTGSGDTGHPGPDLCEEAQVVFDASCVACHGSAPAANLDLRDATTIIGVDAQGAFLPLVDPAGDPDNSYLWRKVAGTHAEVGGGGGQMPPGGALATDAMDAVYAWVDAGGNCSPLLDTGDPGPVGPTPETVVLRRLNRAEYDNTVRDLLDTPLRPASSFPVDDSIDGFDNNAEGLTVSDLHVEMYEQAADALAEDFVERYAIGAGDPIDELVQAEEVGGTVGGPSGTFWTLWSNGNIEKIIDVELSGTYTVATSVYARQGGPDLARMAFLVDGVIVEEVDVTHDDRSNPGQYSIDVWLDDGPHDIAVRFTNDYYDPANSIDRNLYVDWVHITGPAEPPVAGVPGDSPYAAGITCEPAILGDATCWSLLFGPMMRKAFRRPLEPGEVARLVDLLATLRADEDLTWRESVVAGVQAILLSPHFLYRPELDRDGGPGEPQPLTDHELASRLSYFLWSSMPDDTLFLLADAQQLHDPAVLEAQVRRMLQDPKAVSLVDDFAGQWLWLRGLSEAAPDPTLYGVWDQTLEDDLAEEARRLLGSAFRGERSMGDLLTSSSLEINDTLATYYGYTGTLTDWTEVDLSGVERYGILTNAGLLASLSNPTSSNPVRRGKYLLGQLLCDEPGDPPPGVLSSFDPSSGQGSLREQFAAHRSDPSCAVCHDVMDPLGFSLEGYGPAGELRSVDDLGYPVDASGVLPDGRTFDGPAGLGTTLANDPSYPLCVTEKAYTFALGAPPTSATWTYLSEIRDEFVASGLSFEELVVALVTSDAFRMRGE
jgi:hypothetical protein